MITRTLTVTVMASLGCLLDTTGIQLVSSELFARVDGSVVMGGGGGET